jgi:tRNA(fMet)-specific endonuclease VapC
MFTVVPFDQASALAMGAVMVTDNVREFSRVPGLEVENWRRAE